MLLESKYAANVTVTCTLQIFEKREYMYVFGTRTTMIDTLLTTIEQQAREREREKKDDERTEEGGENDHVKKSSSFVCQSFYDDTVVIRIYIHYKASECMMRTYLHFNNERACNLFCTIDLRM